MATTSTKAPTTHGGDVLRDYLWVVGLSCYKVSHDIGVPASRLSAIINGDRAISAQTSVLLGHYFDLGDEYWLRIQMMYDLARARNELKTKLKTLPTIDYSAIR